MDASQLPQPSPYWTAAMVVLVLLVVAALVGLILLWLDVNSNNSGPLAPEQGEPGVPGNTGATGAAGASSTSAQAAIDVATNALTMDQTQVGNARFVFTLPATVVTLPSFNDPNFNAADAFQFMVAPGADVTLLAPVGSSLYGASFLPSGSLAIVASDSLNGWYVNV